MADDHVLPAALRTNKDKGLAICNPRLHHGQSALFLRNQNMALDLAKAGVSRDSRRSDCHQKKTPKRVKNPNVDSMRLKLPERRQRSASHIPT